MDRGLAGLLVAFLAVALAWSFAVPVGEAPDELDHWAYLRYVAGQHRLPVYGRGVPQSHQMPLYYLLAAPLAASSPLPASIGVVTPSGIIASPEPPKMYRNNRGDMGRYWPVRRLRFVSVLLSALAVLACYRAAYLAGGRRSTALVAGGLVAFLPEFAFRAGNVSNDPLMTLFCAIATYYIVKTLRKGADWRPALAGAAAIGLAYVTKAHGAVLLGPWALAIVAGLKTWRERVKRLALAGVFAAIAAGPLLWNWIQLGDPFLLKTAAAVRTPDYIPKSITSGYFRGMFPELLSKSLVAYFGAMNLGAPAWVYGLFGCVAALGVAGCARALWKRPADRKLALVLGSSVLLNLAFVVWVNLTFSQAQGRYLFPSLCALAVLVAIGLEALPGWRPAAGAVLVAGLCAVNLYLIQDLILPAYWSVASVKQEAADKAVGRIAGPFSVGQAWVSPCASVNRIDVLIGTYMMRNGGRVILTVSEADSGGVLARAWMRAAEIQDNSWVSFRFDAVRHAVGRRLYFELSSPDAPYGQGVAAYTSSGRGLEDGTLFVNRAPAPGAVTFRAFCDEDWGAGLTVASVRSVFAGGKPGPESGSR